MNDSLIQKEYRGIDEEDLEIFMQYLENGNLECTKELPNQENHIL